LLNGGGVVVFPTETVYGVAASPFAPGAVKRLVQCKGRPEHKPLALALGNPQELLDWIPEPTKLGRRLSQRCWPGPATLVFTDGFHRGRLTELPEKVRQQVCPHDSLGLRVPAHPAILAVLAELAGPLLLTSANRSGEPDAVSGDAATRGLGEAVDLIIDDGPTRFGRPSSVIRISGERWEMLREGAVSARDVQRLTRCQVLFVCTGNTCRSPLAEGLCRKLLAERLGCTPGELPERGFVVLSAGVSAMMGCRASAEAICAAERRGVDLRGHVSQPLSATLFTQADYVFALTKGHLELVAACYGQPLGQVSLLCPSGEDIADPIGGDQEVYERCAEQIEACLRERVPALEP
jgi:protein-tyrosine phosphatase